VTMTAVSMARRLRVVPLVVQTPLGQGRNFAGVVDLVGLTGLIWPRDGDKGGRTYRRLATEEMRSSMAHAWEEALQVLYMCINIHCICKYIYIFVFLFIYTHIHNLLP
jgi:hypothetical protein